MSFLFCYAGGRLDVGARIAVMGILNITPDSFFPESRIETDAARRAAEMEQAGAAMLDLGAQATNPYASPISAQEEWRRLAPALASVLRTVNIPVSVDTFYPEVAQRALSAGAHIINDISGSLTNGMPALARDAGAGLIAMRPGNPSDRSADDPVAHAVRYGRQLLAEARAVGLPLSQLCFDPGIGFGSSDIGDLRLITQLPTLRTALGEDMPPVLIGVSRKRVVAACCGGDVAPRDRLPGTLALQSVAGWLGARIWRVHDVAAAVQAAAVVDAMLLCENHSPR